MPFTEAESHPSTGPVGGLVDKNNPNKNNPKNCWTYLFKNKNKHPRNWLLLVVLEFCMQHTSNPKPQSLQFGRPMWRRPKPTTPLCARFTACNAAWSCDFTGGTGGPQRAWATGVRAGVFRLCLGRLVGRFTPFWAVFSRLQVNSAVFRPVQSAFGRVKRQNKTQAALHFKVVTYLRTYK